MTLPNTAWIATLSNGEEAVEHNEPWQIIQGERKPWVRLCEYARLHGLHIVALRLNINGQTVHLPSGPAFGFSDPQTSHYSLQYILEVDDLFGARKTGNYLDVAAHLEHNVCCHYIIDLNDGLNNWIVVSSEE